GAPSPGSSRRTARGSRWALAGAGLPQGSPAFFLRAARIGTGIAAGTGRACRRAKASMPYYG
ncbi:hypothetical protein, partial [Treponema endosymbiont of Eucomonympha sp.]|uniref:hypothetical protein n=1 Tax=Treponema endosymbiont of Eucomonympha sp. TaxID=1580831 RepID=UPI001EE703D4